MGRNSTIIVKKKKLKCGCFDYAFSRGRCKAHATQQDSMKRIAEYEEQEDDESVQNLIQDLDAIFSKFIRLKYSNDKGIVNCFTCHKPFTIATIQNGHYVSRREMATRFLEENCRPQCEWCNSRHNDDRSIFTKALERDNPNITQWLEEQARQVAKPTRDELKQLIISYRWKVKILEKKLKK